VGMASLCPICCEVDTDIVLSNCRHASCKLCLEKWIGKEEVSGQTGTPTCPFCRLAILDNDVIEVLGRPFQQRSAIAEESAGHEEIDELTLQWLNEHTSLCQGCGSRIEKESGCDLIECLCGWRFCFRCGLPGGNCGCNEGHFFLNDRGGSYVADEPLRDHDGRVDLRRCIARTEVRQERNQSRLQAHHDMLQRWEPIRLWPYSEDMASVCTSNGRWIYMTTNSERSIKVLEAQFKNEEIRKQRVRRVRNISYQQDQYVTPSWLFGTTPCASFRILKEMIQGSEKVRFRAKKRWEMCRYQISFIPGWLFLPTDHESKRVLARIMSAKGSNELRKRPPYGRREEDFNKHAIDVFINSGAWIFQRPSRDASIAHLAKLLRHSKMKSTLSKCRGRGDCGGPFYRDCPRCKKRDYCVDEGQNLQSIFFVFH